jgi:hypothetical protein
MLTDEGKRTAEECLERSGMGSGENASKISQLKEACMGRIERQNQGNVVRLCWTSPRLVVGSFM